MTAVAPAIRHRNAQSKTKNLLGKILRINVNGTGSGTYGRYAIPSTNPFRGSISGRDEIWAYGLRNPWRISFDRATGDAVHRRRRPEPLRGDRPRAGRLHAAAATTAGT